MFESNYRLLCSKRRKRMALRINSEGILELLAPEGTTAAAADKVIANHRKVIEKLFQEFSAKAPAPRYEFKEGELFPLWERKLPLKLSARLLMMTENELIVPSGSPEEIRKNIETLYRRTAPELLMEKCRFFGRSHQLMPLSVGVTGAVSRWGSCNSRKHISFCWKVLLLPEELADYIVCHELAHLRELNHSPRFWALTELLCPGALEKRKKLRQLPELWPEEK